MGPEDVRIEGCSAKGVSGYATQLQSQCRHLRAAPNQFAHVS